MKTEVSKIDFLLSDEKALILNVILSYELEEGDLVFQNTLLLLEKITITH